MQCARSCAYDEREVRADHLTLASFMDSMRVGLVAANGKRSDRRVGGMTSEVEESGRGKS
jgi:hypothetical protein